MRRKHNQIAPSKEETGASQKFDFQLALRVAKLAIVVVDNFQLPI